MSLNYLVNGSEMQHGAQVSQIKIIHTMVVIFHMPSFLYINTFDFKVFLKKLCENFDIFFAWFFFSFKITNFELSE